MSENTKKIILGNQKYLAIDLSRPLKLDTEGYPGDPRLQRKVFSDINKTGWHHYVHEIGDHCFQPHGDAPNHQNPDLQDKGFEKFDINYCFNRACLIDLSDSDESGEVDKIRYLLKIKKKHLEPFSEQFSKVGAVLIRTGYDKWLESNKPHVPCNIPYFTEKAAKLLASFDNIKVVGIDSLTADPPGIHAVHKALRNILLVESLVHLYEIPVKKRLKFDLQTSPVRIVGATGGPVVAYAFIKL